MGNAFWFSWEPVFITFLQNRITPFLKTIFEAITFFGDEYAMILIIGFLFWGLNKKLGKKIGIYAITSLVTSIVLNNLVMRRRPYFDHSDIRCLKPRSSKGDPYDLLVQGYSFPSGHATNSVSTYTALGLSARNKILKVLLFIIPVAIGLSRLVLGVHYPTDILAGWLLSALVILVVSRIDNQYIVYLILALIGVAGCFFCKSTDYYSALGIAYGFMAGFIFEDKYVRFKNTSNVLFMILRTIGGLAVFVLLDKILKLPFSDGFLNSGTMLSLLIRSFRYAAVSFVLIGVYPLFFGFIDRKMGIRQSECKNTRDNTFRKRRETHER